MESLAEQASKNNELKIKWDRLKSEHPKLRAKDAADKLGVSEAELVASACDGEKVVRLTSQWEGIFKRLEELGKLMALTRNESVVHEKTGVYRNVSFKAHAGLVLDEQIDLRVFHKRWGSAFALPVENPRGTLHSLQFFDKAGNAVHKIYLKDESKLDFYKDLVEQFRSDKQGQDITIREQIGKEENIPIDQIESKGFLEKWSELKDTHDFYPLLRKFKAGRTDALRLAEGKFTTKVNNKTVRTMLNLASEDEVPIMVFVGNPGMIQIHSGPVITIRESGNWLNILDTGFNLHLRQDHIADSWIVEKPTEDGTVTSLELFDEKGESIATFFGARKPGKPELESWRTVIRQVKSEEAIQK